MDETGLRLLIDGVRNGSISADDAVAQLSRLPFTDVGDALVDHHRALRQGAPEAVYGPGKTPDQCVRIVGELMSIGSGAVLITRTDKAQSAALTATYPGAQSSAGCLLWRAPTQRGDVKVAVVTAGTSDLLVADEAAISLRAAGIKTTRITDVGVSGLHRLLARLDDITAADAVIVCAGMEGALASVIGGLTKAPVVAVPTSVGYGAALDGVTALLAMHASCASGITVVGIDNGFGAAAAIGRILARKTAL